MQWIQIQDALDDGAMNIHVKQVLRNISRAHIKQWEEKEKWL